MLQKLGSLWLLAIGMASLLAIPQANALQYYTRSRVKKQHPHYYNRYIPHLPPHLAKQQTKRKPPCKQHGRALCLGPKAPDFSDFYTRTDYNGVQVKKTHPRIRKVTPPKIYRLR